MIQSRILTKLHLDQIGIKNFVWKVKIKKTIKNYGVWCFFCTIKILCCTVLYCTLLYSTVLYCTVLYCTVLYCTVLYCTALHLKLCYVCMYSYTDLTILYFDHKLPFNVLFSFLSVSTSTQYQVI